MSVSKFRYTRACDHVPCAGDCDLCSQETDEAMRLIDEMYDLVMKVNVNEIANHWKDEAIFNWTGAWREDAVAVLKDLEEVLENERD